MTATKEALKLQTRTPALRLLSGKLQQGEFDALVLVEVEAHRTIVSA